MSAQSLGSRAILGRLFLRLQMAATDWVDSLSMLIVSDQASETHKWLGMSPQMREWVNGRIVHGLRAFGITITNVEFEATIAIYLNELRRDKTAQIRLRIDELAARARSHPAKLLTDKILAGESEVCYDGQFFFDTDHTEGDSGTQSNDITIDISTLAIPAAEIGSVTDPGVKTMQKVILQVIQQMFGLKDDQGEPINEGATDFLIMVPTTLWSPAVNAVAVPNLGGGETNVLANLPKLNISVVPNARLTWTDKIAAFRADGSDGGRPFIKQEEVPLSVTAQAEGSSEEFNNRRHLYGVEWTGAFGYGFWQHACLGQMI